MKIKFSVKYEYVPSAPENERFQATVSTLIPKELNSLHIQEYYEGKIGDKIVRGGSFEILDNFYKDNSVKICVKFSAGSSEELKKNVENAIESYRQQVLLNIESMKKTRENREITINLPDPIKFSVKYYYYPLCDDGKNWFNAEVSAFLPKAQGKEHISLCYFGKIGEREINYDSGVSEGDSRRISVNFRAESFEELNRKIDCALEQYRQQVLLNLEIMKGFTENREIIINLPDPDDSPEPDC